MATLFPTMGEQVSAFFAAPFATGSSDSVEGMQCTLKLRTFLYIKAIIQRGLWNNFPMSGLSYLFIYRFPHESDPKATYANSIHTQTNFNRHNQSKLKRQVLMIPLH